MFDPSGFTGRLRACPFLGTWRALLCGEVFVRALDQAAAFFGGWMTRESSTFRSGTGEVDDRTYSGRSPFLRRQAGLKRSCRQRRLETV